MQIDRGTLLELLLKAEIEWHGVHAEPDGDKTLWKGDIETFFKLAAEHEREACAKVVNDDRGLSDDDAIRLMRAIRARSNNA